MTETAIIPPELADDDDGPSVMLPQKRLLLVTASLLLSQMLSAFDTSIVSTAMPRIVADLAGLDLYSWVTAANLVAMTTTIPIAGKLGDLFGRKRFLQAGIVGFTVASMLAGLSGSMAELLAARAVQGAFAGILSASSIASLADLYLPATRARMQGVFMTVFAVASISGPILGGVLTDQLGWRSVFYFNVPLAIAATIAVAMLMPRIEAEGKLSQIDVRGAVLLAVGLVPFLIGITAMRDGASPLVFALLGFSGVALVLFIWVEKRADHPVMPLGIFADPRISGSVIVAGLGSFSMMGSNIYIPLVYQGVLQLSATASGFLLAPRIVGVVLAALVSGQIVSRSNNYRYLGVAGFAGLAAGMFLLARVTTASNEAEVMRDLLLIGVGFGLTQPIYQNVVMSVVPHRFVGVASSQVQFSRALGQTIGVTALGAAMAAQIDSSAIGAAKVGAALTPDVIGPLQAGLASAFMLGGAASALAVVVAIFVKEVPMRGRKRRPMPIPVLAAEAQALAD